MSFNLIASALSSLTSVVRAVMASSAMAPQIKTDLHATLDSVLKIGEDIVAAAPVVVGELAQEGVSAVGAMGGPAGEAVADVVGPVVAQTGGALINNIVSVIENHNKSLIAELQSLLN